MSNDDTDREWEQRSVPACPKCATLEAEIARLTMEHEDICREDRETMERNEHVELCASEMVKRVDEAKADLAAATARAELAEREVARRRRAVEEMARRRVYLLFAGTQHPRGGGYDLVGIFGTLDEAKAAKWDGNWASIFRLDGRSLDPVCDAGTKGWEEE